MNHGFPFLGNDPYNYQPPPPSPNFQPPPPSPNFQPPPPPVDAQRPSAPPTRQMVEQQLMMERQQERLQQDLMRQRNYDTQGPPKGEFFTSYRSSGIDNALQRSDHSSPPYNTQSTGNNRNPADPFLTSRNNNNNNFNVPPPRQTDMFINKLEPPRPAPMAPAPGSAPPSAIGQISPDSYPRTAMRNPPPEPPSGHFNSFSADSNRPSNPPSPVTAPPPSMLARQKMDTVPKRLDASAPTLIPPEKRPLSSPPEQNNELRSRYPGLKTVTPVEAMNYVEEPKKTSQDLANVDIGMRRASDIPSKPTAFKQKNPLPDAFKPSQQIWSPLGDFGAGINELAKFSVNSKDASVVIPTKPTPPTTTTTTTSTTTTTTTTTTTPVPTTTTTTAKPTPKPKFFKVKLGESSK